MGDDTLTSLFIAGLVPALKHELLTRRPSSQTDAMALAQQLAASRPVSAATAVAPSRSQWQRRDQCPQPAASAGDPKLSEGPKQVAPPPRPPREGPNRDYPLIRISAAERADRTVRNLCWYCPEKYSREHIFSKIFYVLMGGRRH